MTAVARELTAFIWELLRELPCFTKTAAGSPEGCAGREAGASTCREPNHPARSSASHLL